MAPKPKTSKSTWKQMYCPHTCTNMLAFWG
jgi:hypothetical protein